MLPATFHDQSEQVDDLVYHLNADLQIMGFSSDFLYATGTIINKIILTKTQRSSIIKRMENAERNEGSDYKLQPNAPAVFPEYGSYAKHIYDGILAPDVFNIALFGPYKTGKSSIIKKFEEMYRRDTSKLRFFKIKHDRKRQKTLKIKKVSFINFHAEKTDESMKNNEENSSGTNNKTAIRKTLQSEIVKQLYFGEKPSKLRFSKFSRINPRLCYIMESLISVLTATMVASNFKSSLEIMPWWAALAACVAISIFSVSAGMLAVSLISKMRIKALGFGGISAELKDGELDFEQMIDEIIYFFKVTGYDIIIFEDLDRLNNEQIYEDLRQLNFLINESKSVKRKVTFIYALKDSLFEDGSNRAKLFDLPIHVVPFLSPFNSLDELKKVMKKVGIDYAFDEKLLNIIAKELTDRRRIVSFVNMLAIYLEKMSQSKLELDENKIAAMVLLRELKPKEYEEMLDGKSSVDTAYSNGAKSRENEAEKAAKDISSRQGAEKKVAEIANSAWEYVQTRIRNGYVRTLKRDDGTEIKAKDFADINFWKEIAKGSNHITVYGHPRNERFDLSEPENDNKISEQISELLKILKHDNGYYLKERNSIMAKQALSMDLETVRDFKELIEQRYIDDDYSLYLAPYNGSEQDEKIVNFEQGVFRRNVLDPRIELSKDQWCKIIGKLGKYDYANRAFLNYSFYDYLLASRPENISKIIKQMLNVSKEDFLVFYSGYIDRCIIDNKFSKNAKYITDILAEMRPGILCEYYVGGLPQKGEEYNSLKTKIFNVLVANDELLDDGGVEYVIGSLHLLPETIDDESIVSIIQRHGDVKVESLAEYKKRPALQKQLIEAKLYAANRDNISVVRELVERGIVVLSDTDVRELLDCCSPGDFEWHDIVPIIAYCKGDKKATKDLLALAPEPYKRLASYTQAKFDRESITKGVLLALQKKKIIGKTIESKNNIRVYLKKK